MTYNVRPRSPVKGHGRCATARRSALDRAPRSEKEALQEVGLLRLSPSRRPFRDNPKAARLLEPSCVGEEWHKRYRDLANYVGEHLADRMLRKAREKRDAEADKQRDAKRIAAAMMGNAEQRPAKPPVGKAGRPFGTGYDKQDAPLIEEMHRLIVEGKASSGHAAARVVVGDGSKVAGVSDLDSKVLRLVDGYGETYREL